MKRSVVKYLVLLTALSSVHFAPSSQAFAQATNLITFKAVSLLRFMNYMDVKKPSIDICVVGDNQVLELTRKFNDTKSGKSKANSVRSISPSEVASCSLVYISKNSGGVASVISGAGNKSIITVSDKTGFAAQGGIIEMYEDDGKLKFAINLKKATKNGITIDSRLIEAADKIL